jgi:hypothetical protein
MELVNNIIILYEQIGERILTRLSDSVKINIEKRVDKRIGAFTITLEIFVLKRAQYDDYGLVFATNAQVKSHYPETSSDNGGGLLIMSDLSTGDGQIIDSTEEFVLFPNSKDSIDYAFKKIELFVQTIAPSVYDIIAERYG